MSYIAYRYEMTFRTSCLTFNIESMSVTHVPVDFDQRIIEKIFLRIGAMAWGDLYCSIHRPIKGLRCLLSIGGVGLPDVTVSLAK